jgi:sugar phosphate isomerase/epimerase
VDAPTADRTSLPRDSSLTLACADSAFPRLTHAGALAVIRDLGIDAVDVCVFAGYDHNPPEAIEADPARAAETVGERVSDFGLRISDVFGILGETFQDRAVNHPDEDVRNLSMRFFEALLEFARRLDAPGVTILPGSTFKGVDEDESLALAATELERRAVMAGDMGLRFAIEPHFDSVVPTPARTLELLERTENVGVALDLSHFVFAGVAQQEAYPLIPRTRHVHLRQARPGVIQARAREGVIDFLELRERLVAAGYEGYLTLEYQWEEGPPHVDFTGVDCIAETAALRDMMLT